VANFVYYSFIYEKKEEIGLHRKNLLVSSSYYDEKRASL